MNKICVSLLAIAALSSAALAGSNRNYDLRDSPTYFGKDSENVKKSSTITVVTPLAIYKDVTGLSNFERLKKVSEENDHGRH
jgi:hypothetical protein